MNILFIGYWAFHDGLTSATVIPHLELLSQFDEVNQIIFTSIERDPSVKTFDQSIDKVTHMPLYSTSATNVLLNKWHDFTVFPKRLIQYCEDYQIDKIICRGAPAGALGYLVWRKNKLPFIVESFEPHAQYMLESGVWKKYDPRYLLEYYWEEKQKKYAESIITVSDNYRIKLLSEGVSDSKLYVVPCTINLDEFAYKQEDRAEVRKKYNIDIDSTVGVYVGKFGGIYLDEEAFDVFNRTLNQCEKPVLFLLTPDAETEINRKADLVGLRKNVRLIVLLAKHKDVPKYLSASDLAFATIKPSPSRKYCSAIKVGEYYANGLPTIITEGVGDDSDIIVEEFAGLVINESLEIDVVKLKELLAKPKSYYQKIAARYRNPEIDKQVYKKILF